MPIGKICKALVICKEQKLVLLPTERLPPRPLVAMACRMPAVISLLF